MNTKTLILSLSAAVGLAYFSHPQELALTATSRVTQLPENVLKLLSFGHKNTLAKMYLIQGIQEFGDAIFDKTDHNKALRLFEYSLLLNPRDRATHNFVITGIETKHYHELIILEQVYPFFKNDWQLSLFYAMKLAEYKQEYSKASLIMKRFSNTPNLPKHINQIWQTFADKNSFSKTQIFTYFEKFLQTNDLALKKQLELKIRSFFTTQHQLQLDHILKKSSTQPLFTWKRIIQLWNSQKNIK